jgi:cytosine/adenosine deaminase-related metal-dependent hydrolase
LTVADKTLIAGGCVLTLDPKIGNFTRGDVLIEGDTVAEVGRDLGVRGAEVVDATDTIVMPGFVDSHRHVWHSLFRHVGEGGTPQTYGPHYRPDDVHAAILGGLLGAVEAGITTVVDWFDLDLGDDNTEAALAAHAEAGVRSVFAPARRDGSPHDDWRAALERLHETWGERPLSTLAAGVEATPPAGPDDLADDWSLAGKLGLRIHAHVGRDSSNSGMTAELGRRGMLSDGVTLVDCTHLSGADFDAISSSGAGVVLTPASAMSGGTGLPPIQDLIDREIRPGLGVGSDHDSPGDIFAQMRAVISMQHATRFDLKLAGKAGLPTLLTTRDVIRYATTDGTRAVGLGPAVGTLAPGRQADLILLRTDSPNIFPVNDPIGAVVWGMDTSNVDWVFVAGRPVKRAGVLQADVAAVRESMVAAARRVAGATGLVAETVRGAQ